MKRAYGFLIAVSFLVGCTDSGPSGPARPAASPEMTKQATHAVSSVQKLFELKSGSAKSSPRPFPRHIAWMALEPIYPGAPDNRTGESKPTSPGETKDGLRLNADNSARQLEKVLSPNDCIFDIPVDKDPGTVESGLDVEIPNVHASISGPNCPLEALIEVKGAKTGNTIRATILLQLTAKTPEMQRELRAKSFRLTGNVNADIVQGADKSVAADVRGTMAGQGELLTGEQFATTISYGMKMNMKMPDQNTMPTNPGDGGNAFPLPMDFMTMEMSQSQRYDFGESATTLSMNAVMKGFTDFKETYLINGRVATRDEFEEYASQIDLPGMQNPGSGSDTSPIGPGPAPGNDRPLLCTLTAYDARETSLRQLEDALATGSAVRGFPLQSLRSCQDNVTTEFKAPAIGDVKLAIIHQFDYVTGDVVVNGRPHQLFMQREYAASLAAENAGVTFTFQCQPVAKCGN